MSSSAEELHAPSESSSLLLTTKVGQPRPATTQRLRLHPRILAAAAAVLLLLCAGSFVAYSRFSDSERDMIPPLALLSRFHPQNDLGLQNFPSDFVWGAATSSYQIEGATREDGRGPTVWDSFVLQDGAILDHSTGDIACDHYHRVEQDVALMKDLNITSYRFSIAWSRILPTGDRTGGINPAGINFYNHLIDTLIRNDIIPFVTLFHWDTPQALQDRYGGWLDAKTAEIFAQDYARTAFETFGDRVRHWITINEPWTVAVNGYSSGIHAPGHQSATEPYIVGHNLLLAHAKATLVYRKHFQDSQKGVIGIANSGDFRYPAHPENGDDEKAAERSMLFQYGWFADPLFFGDYPSVMRQRIGDRLPRVSEEEQKLFLEASTDFLGLNYYLAFLASTPKHEADYVGYWSDIHVDFSDKPEWGHNAMGWNVVPDGLREMLLWVSDRYNHPRILVTENGSAENEPDLESSLNDEYRRAFLEDHLNACSQAIKEGVDVGGYFAWSLMDNFEWQFGYQRRFGIYHVDFDTLERTAKKSALFYRSTIAVNGQNIGTEGDSKEPVRSLARRARSRPLPSRVLIGYSNDCDAVRVAVANGVNIVIWVFVDFTPSSNGGVATPTTSLNLTAIDELIVELDSMGHDDVVHLIAVGGWNGPHLHPGLSAVEWYNAFKSFVGETFHGIDWDLEGNDDLTSPFNVFTVDCLDKMGEISRLAHDDGYIVTMAPPQSYLDVNGSQRFSRRVNWTDPSRGWHDDFSYFGRNAYAYVLKIYGDYIDLVSVQFYESYSRADHAVVVDGVKPSVYLVRFVKQLALSGEIFFVDFSEDPDVHLDGGNVYLPLSKLVLGFANAWADDTDDKTLFIPPGEVAVAWKSLRDQKQLPRGFMFWTINEEGKNDVYLARELNMILQPTESADS